MLISAAITRPGGKTGRAAGVFWALALAMLVAKPAGGIEMTALYTAQVPVDREQPDPRASAYAAALQVVLLKVAGPVLADNAEVVAELFPQPSAYVVQFRPGADDTLWVSFDGEAVDRRLRQGGQTVWGSDRPVTLVWLAVDWGDGEREVIGAADDVEGVDDARSIDRNRLLRERILAAAEQRGLPIVLPLLDTDDLRSVSFSDIWGGFDDQLLEASLRYDADSVLVGRVRPDSSQLDRWNYYFGDGRQAWTGEPEQVIGFVADTLAEEFAIRGNEPLESLELSIAGVTTVAAYGAVDRLLAGLRVVERVAIVEIQGDRILYRVDARGGAERLRRALRLGDLVEQEARPGGQYSPLVRPSRLDYYYSPK